jgi:hypothetical protein
MAQGEDCGTRTLLTHTHTQRHTHAQTHTKQHRGPSGSTISDVVPSGTFLTSSGTHVIIGGNGKVTVRPWY